jgi:hypothetical protein
MRRSRPWLLALLPAASLALGCGKAREDRCPGRTIASLALHGVLDPAATGCVVAPEVGWIVPETLPPGTPDGTFDAELAWDDGAERLAYCTGGLHAATLYGTRAGDHIHAEVRLPAAVLASCAATCTPVMSVVVEGDLSAGSPVTFSGTLTETFDGSSGDCAPCQLPCTSSYTLTGTER